MERMLKRCNMQNSKTNDLPIVKRDKVNINNCLKNEIEEEYM